MGTGGNRQSDGNYQEYLRLRNNPEYTDATFDEKSCGLSAVHIWHKLDKTIAPSGIRRGDYELMAIRVLREFGFMAILQSERGGEKVKTCDGLLNNIPMEIKGIEGRGVWSIFSKLMEAEKQGARIVVLIFPQPSRFSIGRVKDGIEKYASAPASRHEGQPLDKIFVIVGHDLRMVFLRICEKPLPEGNGYLWEVLGDRAGSPPAIPPPMQS